MATMCPPRTRDHRESARQIERREPRASGWRQRTCTGIMHGRLAEDFHQRPTNLASLFHRLDGAGPLMHNLVDGLRDSRRIVVATEKDVAADKGAPDVRTGTHAADEIFDRAARLAG